VLESLLVLGQIPGTNLVLDFTQVAFGAYILFLIPVYSRSKLWARLDKRWLALMLLRFKATIRLRLMGYRLV
jgi:hypothetical protein